MLRTAFFPSLWLVLAGLLASQTALASVRGEEFIYDVDGTRLTGYIAYDTEIKGERPGVLVVHEWWGHNAYARQRALMLAELGYTALALDMYGDGKQAEHPDDARKFMMEVMNNMETAEARFDAARILLANNPHTDAERIAAIGYCFGGGVVLHMARKGMDLAGVASFHGTLATEHPAEPGVIGTPILVMTGGADPFVPQEQIAAFREEMDNAGAELTLITYPGVKHSFTNPGATAVGEQFGLPLEYNEAADQASWDALQMFLQDVFAE